MPGPGDYLYEGLMRGGQGLASGISQGYDRKHQADVEAENLRRWQAEQDFRANEIKRKEALMTAPVSDYEAQGLGAVLGMDLMPRDAQPLTPGHMALALPEYSPSAGLGALGPAAALAPESYASSGGGGARPALTRRQFEALSKLAPQRVKQETTTATNESRERQVGAQVQAKKDEGQKNRDLKVSEGDLDRRAAYARALLLAQRRTSDLRMRLDGQKDPALDAMVRELTKLEGSISQMYSSLNGDEKYIDDQVKKIEQRTEVLRREIEKRLGKSRPGGSSVEVDKSSESGPAFAPTGPTGGASRSPTDKYLRGAQGSRGPVPTGRLKLTRDGAVLAELRGGSFTRIA